MKKVFLAILTTVLFVMPVYGQDESKVITAGSDIGSECVKETSLLELFDEAKKTELKSNLKYISTAVNIRKEPDVNSEILGISKTNSEFEVIAEIDGWAMITTEDGYAYMKSDWFVDEMVSLPKKSNLGKFRITHYCGCKKCNGKWTGYPTHSGRYPVDGVTIAVDRSQIAFGTWVEINGHAYRADDTGSGIKRNCIDIYVSDHKTALNKGVYYADVYVMNQK